MNKIERIVISHLVARYLKQVEKIDLMLDTVLPTMEKVSGKELPRILDGIESLLRDWTNEVQEYRKKVSVN